MKLIIKRYLLKTKVQKLPKKLTLAEYWQVWCHLQRTQPNQLILLRTRVSLSWQNLLGLKHLKPFWIILNLNRLKIKAQLKLLRRRKN